MPLVFAASALAAILLVRGGRRAPAPPAAPSPVASHTPDRGDDGLGAASTPAPTPAPPSPAPSHVVAQPGPGGCPPDMAIVEGWFCPFVAHRCEKERRPSAPGLEPVCLEYRAEVLCEGTMERLRYCMDVFEYPNQRGVVPAVLVDFDEAARACEVEGKRLCTPQEHAFACEGEAIHPYAVGEAREPSACRWDVGAEGRVAPSRGPTVAQALALVDRRAASGSHAACVSPFGISDLSGNVAEWVADPQGSRRREPFVSTVAGGAWGMGAASCRTFDASQPPPHRAAAVGFRCCTEAPRDASPGPDRRRARGGGFRPIGAPR